MFALSFNKLHIAVKPVLKPLFLVCIAVATSALIWFGLDIALEARAALIVFALAMISWTMTDLDDTLVALLAALALPILGLQHAEAFFVTLGDSLIWLLIGAFILAAAVGKTTLLQRLSQALTQKARTVQALFWWTSAAIFMTTFFIPSTSGRAALLLPIFIALTDTLSDQRIRRALALLFPTIIVLSAFATPIGAGANLMAIELLARMTNNHISFGYWLLLAMPFTLLSCALATWVIIRVFLSNAGRHQTVEVKTTINAKLEPKERFMLVLLITLVTLWMTESLHGVHSTIITLAAALIVTLPGIGTLSFKDGIKSIKMDLVLFLAATLELGNALVYTGGATWLVESVFSSLGQGVLSSSLLFISVTATMGLLSHFLITSRTARASVLLPLIISLAVSLGYNPVIIVLLTTAATGFCMSLPVCAKPIALFGGVRDSYTPKDLLRLSGILLPIHLLLLVAFSVWVWPMQGLKLTNPVVDITVNPIVTFQERVETPAMSITPTVEASPFSSALVVKVLHFTESARTLQNSANTLFQIPTQD